MANPYDDVVASLTPSNEQPTDNPYDSVVGDIQVERQTRARTVFERALATNPDQAAENKKLAESTGLPADVVERNRDEIKRKEQARQLDLARMAQDSPVLARQLMDPSFTTQAHDDVGTLGQVEQFFRDTGGSMKAGVFNANKGAAGVFRAGFEFAAPVLDFLEPVTAIGGNPLRRLAEGFAMNAEASDVKAKAAAPKTTGNIASGVQSGIQSLTQNLLALPMAFMPGGQGAALSMMTASTGGQSYQDAREKGLSMAQALPYAASQAAIEYATEKLPLSALIGDVKAGTSILKTITKQMALEVPGEQIATVLQDMNDWAVLNPEKPFRDYLAERPDAAAQTLVATLVGTGGNIVVAKGIETATRKLMGDAYDAGLAEQSAEQLQASLQTAMASRLRERNPDEFRALVQGMAENTDGAPQEVYVDAEVLNQLPQDVLAQLPQATIDQLPAALAANDVVSIPVADVLTVAPGTPLEQMLVENARIGDPSAMSQAEAKVAGEQAQQYLAQEAERVIAQATDARAMQESSDRVKAGIFEQLQTAGRFRRDVNDAYATWTTAFYTTMGGRLGLTPEEMAARYPLRIAGQGEAGGLLGQITPEQAMETNVPVEMPTAPEFTEAVGNTPGAQITENGLLIDLVRYQKPEQEGAQSIRTGVFYLPTGSPAAKYYKTGKNNYGGVEKFEGETLLRRPMFVKGATGGKAPEVAYNTIKGKKAYEAMRADVLKVAVGWGKTEQQKIEGVRAVLTQYGADPGLASEIVYYSRGGNTLPYAVQENIVAHAVRAAGYDAVVGYSKGKAGANISEVFDVREQTFPAQGMESEVHSDFYKQGARGTFDPASLTLALNENADLSTFLHESGHFFLEVMADLSSQPDAPAEIQQDMAALLKWFGIKGDENVGGPDAGGGLAQGGRRTTLAKFGIPTPEVYEKLGAKGMEKLASATDRMGYDLTPEEAWESVADTVAYLKRAGVKEVDLYHVTDIADFGEDGIRGSEVSNTGRSDGGSRARSVYSFLDPDDIPKAFDGVLGAVDEAPHVAHVRIPVEDVWRLVWDSNFNVTYGAYSGVRYEGDIPGTRIQSVTRIPAEAVNGTLAQDGNLPTDNTQPVRRTPLETWNAMTLEQKRKYHERFAESFEQYLLEGKAPSVELQPLFRKFSAWMKNVYRSLKAFVDKNAGSPIQLSDEIRQVFDRMLASEEQIAEAETVAGLVPDENATGEAVEKLTARSLRDLKWTVNARSKEIKKLQKQAAELRKGVEAEVRAEVEAQPIYAARKFLRTDTKFAIADLESMYAGEGDRYALFDWKFLVDQKMAGKEGVHPDIVADMFGFSSGDTLIKSLLAAEPIDSVVEGLTDRRMLEEHGDLVDERAIEQAANEAIHNAARAKSLATELKAQAEALDPRTDTGETNAKGSKITVNAIAEAAKQFAANVVARTPLRDLKNRAWQHTAAERRAAKRWQEHTAKAETQDAVKAKQDQMLNHAAAKAAMDAQAEMRKILTFFRRVVKDGNEKTVEKGRDPDVVNAARAILGAYGVAPTGGKTALEYMVLVEKNDPAMYAALQPSMQAALNMAQPLDALTMEELRGLHEEIQGMWHLAKRSRQMEVDGNLMDMDDAETELQARMQAIGVPDTMPGDTGAIMPREEFARKLQHAGSLLRRTEQWAEGMGKAFTKLIFRPVKAAADAYRTDRVKYRKAYQALVDQVAPFMPKGTIAAPELGYTFGQGHNGIGMAELLHAILHTGNESNKRKLLLGRKWATENADGTLDTSRWDAFVARMHDTGVLNKVHYDFAQGVWDLLEQTKPLAQKTHRDVFGRYFAEVTADSVETPFGTYRGGYVPAQADPRLVQDADLRKLAEAENENLAFAFPTTNKGFTKSRVEYNRPLLLDLRTIGQHIDKVLLFAHMEPAVRDVNRLLSRKGVAYSLGRIDPTIYAGMLTPWLNRAAKQIVETPIVGDGGVSRVLSTLRARAGMSLMFANVSNTLQQLTGFSTAFAKLKADGLESHMMRATAQFIAHPKQMAKDVAEASPYMANRMENEIAAINDAIDDILINQNLYRKSQAWFRKHAYFLQSAFDNTMGPIIWTAAYNGHMAKHGDEKEAARYADSTIRQTQGSTLPEDVSRIETGPAYARMFTQFVGYFNMMANTNATALKQIAQEEGFRKGAGKALLVVTMGMLVPIWIAEAIAVAMRGGPGDDDHDGYLDDWLAAVFGMGTIKGSFAMVPFVGQLANAAMNRANKNPADDKMSLSPAVSLLESAVGVPTDVYKALTAPEKLNTRNAVRDVASAVSLATGLPATALARPLGYLAGVADDRIDPTGPIDQVRGMLTGAASPESR